MNLIAIQEQNRHQAETATQAYSKTSTMAHSNIQIMLAAYDKVTARLLEAKDARSRKRLDEEHEAVSYVMRALRALGEVLNDQASAKTAKTVRDFYKHIGLQLAHRHRDADPLQRYDSLVRQISIMRTAWVEVAKRDSGAKEASAPQTQKRAV